MRVVIAPDKFKDCLDAIQVADAIAAGIRRVDPDIVIDKCPMADGGEGTVQALVAATSGRIVSFQVTGPLPRMKVDAPVGLLGDGSIAVVEMASASGLHLLQPHQRDPTRTTSYGTGQLLREAANLGARRIILGLGGSATIDAGIGCAQAWGATFTLSTGTAHGEGDRRLVGGDLLSLHSLPGQLPLDTHGIEFIVACDVGNPLLGPDGAAPIFGPQKGATPEQIDDLEAGLEHLVKLTGRQDLAVLPGAGAAGGMGFGMMVFFNASLRSGIDIVIEAVNLRDRLRYADLCITGEGRLDLQTQAGKTVWGVSQLCRQLHVPCIALAGSIAEDFQTVNDQGPTAWFSIMPGPTTLADAIIHAPELLSRAAENVLRCHMAKR